MISRFREEHSFLSNFYGLEKGDCRLRIWLDGLCFPTVEHAYVAAKLISLPRRLEIWALPKPGQAKRYLDRHNLRPRPHWELMKLRVMEDLLCQKFRDHPKLSQLLLATGQRQLVEGNDRNDTFWGVDLNTGNGSNHLGRLIMRLRSDLE